jgi:hypothetical protein
MRSLKTPSVIGKELTHKIERPSLPGGRKQVNHDRNQWLIFDFVDMEHANQACVPYNGDLPS